MSQLRIIAVPAPEGWVMARKLDGKQGLVPEAWVTVKLSDSNAHSAAVSAAPTPAETNAVTSATVSSTLRNSNRNTASRLVQDLN